MHYQEWYSFINFWASFYPTSDKSQAQQGMFSIRLLNIGQPLALGIWELQSRAAVCCVVSFSRDLPQCFRAKLDARACLADTAAQHQPLKHTLFYDSDASILWYSFSWPKQFCDKNCQIMEKQKQFNFCIDKIGLCGCQQVGLNLQWELPADGVTVREIFLATLGIAHDDGLLISKPCFDEVHSLGHTTCLHQRWKNERSLHLLKRHIGPSDAVLVAHELPIAELKIQRIVRVREGLASPLANFTNKCVPQVSWEIASNAPRHLQCPSSTQAPCISRRLATCQALRL